ncbi:MAG: FAD-binding protein [Candidatus Eisenbacteria bacterium]|nr:FAD-binding protein [Candidatus Eisenbacteria bacterium]
MNITQLKSLIRGELITDEAGLEARASDFGRMVHKKPGAVVRPKDAEDVASVLRFANDMGYQVATRGEAHSQTGQALVEGGIVLDLTSLNAVISVDPEGLTVTCQSGVVWRNLVEHLKPMGLIPRVLTNNLGVTIGGTLSVAGLGVASFRYGTQADNAVELEVVTGRGDIVVCSAEQEPDLFNHVRSGLGQFGVITRATMKVRPFKPMVRRYFFLYDNLDKFMSDARMLMDTDRCDFLESWCVPAPMGFRTVGNEKQTFGEWFFPLHLTKEFDPEAPPDDAIVTKGLSYYRFTHVEDEPIHDFANRLEPLFVLWKLSGYWANKHPWMESVLPWESGKEYIKNVLAILPPASLGGGHILLWPCKGTTSTVPLFMRPPDEWVIGFGILPGVPKERIELAVERLNLASEISEMAGGKRYLSGMINFDKEKWAAHFGEMWPEVNRLKKTYDPKHVLNPGFILYEE